MDISRMFGNWRTTLAGIVLVAMSAFDTFIYDLPQWTVTFADSLPLAFGLLLAKDANIGSGPR